MTEDTTPLADYDPYRVPEPEPEPRTGLAAGLHPVNVAHLVAGLIFLGLALSWLLAENGVLDAGRLDWVLPAILVAAGGAGVVASVARGVRRSG